MTAILTPKEKSVCLIEIGFYICKNWLDISRLNKRISYCHRFTCVIIDMVLSRVLRTYTAFVFALTANGNGSNPTGIVFTSRFVLPSIIVVVFAYGLLV